MWPKSVKDETLVACGRHCCICHKFCSTNIECHHIVAKSQGGKSTFDNCIPLCFDCHADAGNYSTNHPKGTHYSETELKLHRDTWYRTWADLSLTEKVGRRGVNLHPLEIYEGQFVQLKGFVWREAFPGPPSYTSLERDIKEFYWMLILPVPLTLIASSCEDESSYKVEGVKRIQMMLSCDQYDQNRHLILHDAQVTGRLFPSQTGHHHGDALLEVKSIV